VRLLRGAALRPAAAGWSAGGGFGRGFSFKLCFSASIRLMTLLGFSSGSVALIACRGLAL